ncbi:MAG TPA: glycosyltransferase, partial [Phycisphaerae bacterium]|nr:glycosyltransferase [Phycisphaerae bacterium]
MAKHDRRYIMLISVHGLIRGENLELGRDADTGGQTTYVVELARALARNPDVERVDLVTRLVEDSKVSGDYAKPFEEIGPKAQIVRIRCGPRRYLAKERLWPHLDSFVDNLLHYLRSLRWAPDLIHGHYADAGYVAARVSGVLNTPMAFTGHSLGRVKRQRLLDGGSKIETIEKRYNISKRIEAEEIAIDNASFVVASTSQEVEQQYAQYDNYQPQRMQVIPPGVDLARFTPVSRREGWRPPVLKRLWPFLADTDKPMVLAISRADPRKNIAALVRAFAEHEHLRELANLVIVAGNRDDIRELDKGARDVMSELLMLVDYYDLYGHVAYPKHHERDDVPDLYRLAARSRGVFVNPALTEPFGLTLIEAAACGLPIVATHDGGPRDIIGHCGNGVLIDPLDEPAMGAAIHDALADPERWRRWSRGGTRGAQKFYSWDGHVERYLRYARAALAQYGRGRVTYASRKSRLVTADRVLVADIDDTLTGDAPALRGLVERLGQAGEKVAFGIATGRSMAMTEEVLAKWKVPTPQLLITSVGSAIHYGPKLMHDRSWE